MGDNHNCTGSLQVVRSLTLTSGSPSFGPRAPGRQARRMSSFEGQQGLYM